MIRNNESQPDFSVSEAEKQAQDELPAAQKALDSARKSEELVEQALGGKGGKTLADKLPNAETIESKVPTKEWVEAVSVEEKLIEPKKKNLGDALSKIEGETKEDWQERAKEFLKKLQGDRVYYFSKDGKKRYLKLDSINIKVKKGEQLGEKELTFGVYEYNPRTKIGKKIGEETRKISKIQYRDWKKAKKGPETQSVMFRDDQGNFSERKVRDVIEPFPYDEIVTYEKDGEIGYARRTDPYQESPLTSPTLKPESATESELIKPGLMDELEIIEPELLEPETEPTLSKIKLAAIKENDKEPQGVVSEEELKEKESIDKINKDFLETERAIINLNVNQEIKEYLFGNFTKDQLRNKTLENVRNLRQINASIDEMIRLEKKGLPTWQKVKANVEEDLIILNERITRIKDGYLRSREETKDVTEDNNKIKSPNNKNKGPEKPKVKKQRKSLQEYAREELEAIGGTLDKVFPENERQDVIQQKDEEIILSPTKKLEESKREEKISKKKIKKVKEELARKKKLAELKERVKNKAKSDKKREAKNKREAKGNN